jgi:hypothetical protein
MLFAGTVGGNDTLRADGAEVATQWAEFLIEHEYCELHLVHEKGGSDGKRGMTTTTLRALRVNLGSGDFPASGWTNVDHGTPHPHDVTADLTKPLPDGLAWIGQVYAGHVLEHLTPEQVVNLLVDLRGRMVPGGQLMAVGPDVVRARSLHGRGELDDGLLRLIVEGGDRWPGNRHLWECGPARLVDLMTDAGWRMARKVPVMSVSQLNWPIVAYDAWQCAVTAYA